MKKLLLALAVILGTGAAATAQSTAVFNAEGNNLPAGTFDDAKVVTISGATTADGLAANDWTVPGALTVKFSNGTNNSNYPGVGTWKHFRTYTNNTITITPEAGVTITGVTIRYTEAKYVKNYKVDGADFFTIDGTTGTWTGSKTDAIVLTATATNRAFYIAVTYTGGQEAVAEPEFSVASSFVEANTAVSLTCATAGAKIYYTLDGTEPTEASTEYAAPIVVNGYTVINAIAAKQGAATSNVVTAKYGVICAPQGAKTATFDFTDITTLDPAQAFEGDSKEIAVNETEFVAGAITLSFDKGEAGTDCRIYNATTGTSLRTYAKSGVTFTAKDATINNIEFVDADPFGLEVAADNAGYVIGAIWSAEADKAPESVSFASAGNSTMPKIVVSYTEKIVDGIADVAVDADAAVEYFNLQGVRMQGDMAPGLYIRRQGNKTAKVLVK